MELIDIVAPPLGAGVESMLVVAWNVDPGGAVSPGDPLFEVETDKAVFEVEAEVAGTLVEILVGPGDLVKPGDPVGRVRPG